MADNKLSKIEFLKKLKESNDPLIAAKLINEYQSLGKSDRAIPINNPIANYIKKYQEIKSKNLNPYLERSAVQRLIASSGLTRKTPVLMNQDEATEWYKNNQLYNTSKKEPTESPESDDLDKLFQEYIDALNTKDENTQQAMSKYNEQINKILKIIKNQFFEFDPTDPKMNQTIRTMRGPTMQKLENQRKLNKNKYIKGLYSHLFHGDNQLLAEAMNDTKTTQYIADKLNQSFDIALNPNADINARKAAARYLGEGLLSKDYGKIKSQAMASMAGFAGVLPQMFSAEGSLTQMMLQNQRGGQVSDKIKAAIWQHYLALDDDEKKEFEKTDAYQMMVGGNRQSLYSKIQNKMNKAFAATVGDTDES